VQRRGEGPDGGGKPTSPWAAFAFRGRRICNRRASEHQRPYFVDRFTASMFALILLVVGCTVIDGLITLRLMTMDCEEINPVMDYFLKKGSVPFLLGKYLLTVAGLPVLLIFKN